MPSLSLGVTATISRLVRLLLLLLFAEEAVRGGEPAVDLGVFAFELVGLIPEDKEIVNLFLFISVVSAKTQSTQHLPGGKPHHIQKGQDNGCNNTHTNSRRGKELLELNSSCSKRVKGN